MQLAVESIERTIGIKPRRHVLLRLWIRDLILLFGVEKAQAIAVELRRRAKKKRSPAAFCIWVTKRSLGGWLPDGLYDSIATAGAGERAGCIVDPQGRRLHLDGLGVVDCDRRFWEMIVQLKASLDQRPIGQSPSHQYPSHRSTNRQP